MAANWKARLVSIDPPGLSDSFNIQVLFHDDSTRREIPIALKLTAGNVTDIADVKAMTDERLKALEALDRVRTILTANIGQDL